MVMDGSLLGVMGQASTNLVGLAHAGECLQELSLSVRKHLPSIRPCREMAYVGQLDPSVRQYLLCNWRGQEIVPMIAFISVNQSYAVLTAPVGMTPSTFLLS
jgi:hypothetical protein